MSCYYKKSLLNKLKEVPFMGSVKTFSLFGFIISGDLNIIKLFKFEGRS